MLLDVKVSGRRRLINLNNVTEILESFDTSGALIAVFNGFSAGDTDFAIIGYYGNSKECDKIITSIKDAYYSGKRVFVVPEK